MGTNITMSDNDSILNSPKLKNALLAADRGWPVLPLHFPVNGKCSCFNPTCTSHGKHPMTRQGFKDASCDKQIVSDWWLKNPNANLGIRTGKESGIVVLDIDPRHGGDDSLEELQKEYAPLPETLSVRTGGGGFHFYFQYPNFPITNRVNIRPGLDFRGDGGYIVGPPSTHISQKSYIWNDPNAEIAELPQWLIDILTNRSSKKEIQESINPKNSGSGFFSEGSRNNSLLSIAGFLKSKGMEADIIFKALSSINQDACNPPLLSDEVEKIANSINRYQESPWPELQDLPEPSAAPAMSPDMLPSALQPWCLDIAERMQVPLEFVAGPAVVMFASMIGRRVVICPKQHDDWQVVPNLWGSIIAPPGALKSPTMNAVFKPLNDLAIKARNKYLEELKNKEKQEIIAKTEIEALKDGLKHAVKSGKNDKVGECKDKLELALREYEEKYNIHERRYMINDPTIEKLLSLLEENPQGLLLFRDELSGWMETMHKSGREGDREFFLESWNGDSTYSMDRIGRGSTFVDGLCLSVMGGLQPGKFSSYVASMAKGGKSNDGLLQRFQILLFPERRKKWKRVDRKPDHEAASKIEAILSMIDFLPIPKRENSKIQRLQLRYSESAQHVADNWHEGLENRMDSGTLSPIFESHLSKYRSLLPSLALIFSIIDSLSGSNLFPLHIKQGDVELAIKWCDFLEAHARKAYGEFIQPEEAAGRCLLEKIKDGSVKDYDKCRDIYRRGWKGLTTTENFEDALKILKKYGWVRTETITPVGGGRSEVVRLNPVLRFVKI